MPSVSFVPIPWQMRKVNVPKQFGKLEISWAEYAMVGAGCTVPRDTKACTLLCIV